MLAAPASMSRILEEFMDRMRAPQRLREALAREIVRKLGHSLDESDIANLGEMLTAQLLIIHDEEDRVVPLWEAELITGRLPGVRLVKTRGFGHYRMAKDPGIWEVAIRFITLGKVSAYRS